MTKFNYSLLEQSKMDGRWYTQRKIFENVEKTEENLRLTIAPETMKFFRRSGSKQQIRRTYKNGKVTIKVFSYNPFNEKHRNVHIFEEV